jgi:hypothetical protein
MDPRQHAPAAYLAPFSNQTTNIYYGSNPQQSSNSLAGSHPLQCSPLTGNPYMPFAAHPDSASSQAQFGYQGNLHQPHGFHTHMRNEYQAYQRPSSYTPGTYIPGS